MKPRNLFALCTLLFLSGTVLAGTTKKANANLGPELDRLRFFTGNVQMGFYDGVGFHFSGTFANFAQGFPFGLRIGFGHAWIPTGDAVLARRIFINQNTGGNGNARSKGSLWDYRFDLLYPV
ncbi:MAG: hypothetical protein ACREBV_07180 [Candidatus Zixiibacteriota bacterium]